MLSDIFPTGYHGTELAKVMPGNSVAIFGAGPVGLMAAHSAWLRIAVWKPLAFRRTITVARSIQNSFSIT